MAGGLFIAFEGVDGAGKTTHARTLYGLLCQQRISARLVREPGGTPLGEALRTLVSVPRQVTASVWRLWLAPPRPDSQLAYKDLWLRMDPMAEVFLFAASRYQLVAEVIRPSLAAGRVIVCDRYIHSTLAYQGYGRGLNLNDLRRINELATGGLEPDLAILLDIKAAHALSRKRRTTQISRFEEEGAAFQEKVRQGYLEMAQSDPDRWYIVDSSQPRSQVTKSVWERVRGLLPEGRPVRVKPGRSRNAAVQSAFREI